MGILFIYIYIYIFVVTTTFQDELWRWDLQEFGNAAPIPQEVTPVVVIKSQVLELVLSHEPGAGQGKTCETLEGAMFGIFWRSTLF